MGDGTIVVRADLFHALRNFMFCLRTYWADNVPTWVRSRSDEAWAMLALAWPVEDVAALENVIALAPKVVYQGRLRRTFDLLGVVSLSAARTLKDTDLLCIRNFGEASLKAWQSALLAYDTQDPREPGRKE